MTTKTKMRVVESAGALVWSDRVSGREVFKFDMTDVAPALHDAVFAYGVKQIIADGAAGSPDPAAAMRARAAMLRDGTWGTRAPRFPDADIWAAVVAVRGVADSEVNRAKWVERSAAERRAVARLPEIAAWLVDNTPEPPNVEELLAGL